MNSLVQLLILVLQGSLVSLTESCNYTEFFMFCRALNLNQELLIKIGEGLTTSDETVTFTCPLDNPSQQLITWEISRIRISEGLNNLGDNYQVLNSSNPAYSAVGNDLTIDGVGSSGEGLYACRLGSDFPHQVGCLAVQGVGVFSSCRQDLNGCPDIESVEVGALNEIAKLDTSVDFVHGGPCTRGPFKPALLKVYKEMEVIYVCSTTVITSGVCPNNSSSGITVIKESHLFNISLNKMISNDSDLGIYRVEYEFRTSMNQLTFLRKDINVSLLPPPEATTLSSTFSTTLSGGVTEKSGGNDTSIVILVVVVVIVVLIVIAAVVMVGIFWHIFSKKRTDGGKDVLYQQESTSTFKGVTLGGMNDLAGDIDNVSFNNEAVALGNKKLNSNTINF